METFQKYRPAEAPPTVLLSDARRFFRADPNRELSIRGLSRLTGIPYSTLRDIISGTTRNPSPATVQRIADSLGSLTARRSEGLNTVRVDAPVFTSASIANLAPPPGSQAIAFVVRTPVTPSGRATTDWDPDSSSVADSLRLNSLTPGMVVRVLFHVGTSRR